MIEVYKYGGNLLKDEGNRNSIYNFIKYKLEKGIKIVMVVSAFGREKDSFSTDNLSKNIELLSDKDKDQIMTFGEIYSSLIVKNELLREGINASNLYYDEIGILCDNTYQNGNIKDVDMSNLKELLLLNDVIVVPGFIGESSEGKIISLGRNTSDLTGAIIAKELGVDEVNIIKEVDGVFKKDPKRGESKLIKELSYDEMISLVNAGSKMFAKKTLEYAKDNGVIIKVKGLNKEEGSVISDISSNEDILFVDKDKSEIRVVFKDMNIFNKLFASLIENKLKLDDLTVMNNVIYIKGNQEDIEKVIDENL